MSYSLRHPACYDAALSSSPRSSMPLALISPPGLVSRIWIDFSCDVDPALHILIAPSQHGRGNLMFYSFIECHDNVENLNLLWIDQHTVQRCFLLSLDMMPACRHTIRPSPHSSLLSPFYPWRLHLTQLPYSLQLYSAPVQ